MGSATVMSAGPGKDLPEYRWVIGKDVDFRPFSVLGKPVPLINDVADEVKRELESAGIDGVCRVDTEPYPSGDKCYSLVAVYPCRGLDRAELFDIKMDIKDALPEGAEVLDFEIKNVGGKLVYSELRWPERKFPGLSTS